MRVLHILIEIRKSWGGPVRSVCELVRMQRDLGFEPCVLSVEREGEAEDFDGAAVVTFAPSFPARFGNSNAAISWLQEHAAEFDLVLVSEIWSVMIQRAMLVLRELKVPYIVQPRGSLDPYDLRKKAFLKAILGRWFVGKNLAAARCVLTASHTEGERVQSFGTKIKRHTLPHPVQANPPGNRRRMREELGLGPETVAFLFLSRIDPKKRADLLVEAYAKAFSRLPDSRLLIAGDGPPRLVAELKERAQRLGRGDEVRFLGFQGGQRKSDLLAAANVFVLPSDFENFGIAVVEALHAGLPVILSTGVQLWQGIVDAGAGLSFSEKAEDLTELLVRVGTQRALRSSMSEAALSYAAGFTPEKLSPVYHAFWSSVARSPAERVAMECIS